MDIALNDDQQMAYVSNWNAGDWSAQSSTIPDAYTIQFQPSVEDTVIQSIANGRELNIQTAIVYSVTPLGNGYVSTPSTLFTQQLLPLPDPAPDSDSTTEASS